MLLKKTHRQLKYIIFSMLFFPVSLMAIDLDDDEEDYQDAIEAAQQAGKSEKFSTAREHLREARMLGVDSAGVKETELQVDGQETAYKQRLEAERKAREKAEAERLVKIERKRRQKEAARYASQSNGSSGSIVDFVLVNVECISSFLYSCFEKNLQISGGPGQFEPGFNGANLGAIHKGYKNALAGRYNWSAKVGDSYCSGSFYLSGTKRSYSLRIFPDGCRDGGSGEY